MLLDTFYASDLTAMEKVGADLMRYLSPGNTVFLIGDLGAGKTTLVRAALRSKGFEGAVKSPTFTLVETYHIEDIHIAHFDLYRLADPEELEYMGYRDYFDDDTLCFFEWPEKGLGLLPHADLTLNITFQDQGRLIQAIPASPSGEKWLSSTLFNKSR